MMQIQICWDWKSMLCRPICLCLCLCGKVNLMKREREMCRDWKSMPASNLMAIQTSEANRQLWSQRNVSIRDSPTTSTIPYHTPIFPFHLLICWFKGETIVESGWLFDLRSYMECVAIFLFWLYCTTAPTSLGSAGYQSLREKKEHKSECSILRPQKTYICSCWQFVGLFTYFPTI